MKHYIETVTVEPKGVTTLTMLDGVSTHDLDVLSYLKPKERIAWLEVHKAHVLAVHDMKGELEYDEWRMKNYGVYIRVVDTYE